MQFYGHFISPFSMRVWLQVRAKGLDIPMVEAPMDIHEPGYRKINPLGKMPALDTFDDGVIPESAVICEYLEARFPEPSLLGSNPGESARIRTIGQIADIYVMNALLPIFPELGQKPRNQDVLERAATAVTTGLGHLDHFISPGPYAAGERFSLADCACAPFLFYVDRFLPVVGVDAPFAATPNVAGYWSQAADDPLVAEALEGMRAAFAAYS